VADLESDAALYVGAPLRFLSWFDFADEYQFNVSVVGRFDKSQQLRATFRSVGIYHSDNEVPDEEGSEDYGEDSEEISSSDRIMQKRLAEARRSSESNGVVRELVTMSGFLVDAYRMPKELSGN
jgi:hypothetical protein